MHQFLFIGIAIACIIHTRDVSAFTTRHTKLSNRRVISQSSCNPSLNNLTPTSISSSSSNTNPFFSGTTNDRKFQSIIENSSDDTVQLLREELKSRLLSAVDEYNTMRALEEEAAAATKAKAKEEEDNKEDRGYVIRLLHRIIRKISKSKKKNTTATAKEDGTTKQLLTQSKGILTSDSFRQETLNVGPTGQQVIELAEQLSLLNPTPIPTLGFKQYKVEDDTTSSTQSSKLDGNWKLRFTTASDASFPKSTKRGVTTTSQVINAEKGTFTNVIQFEKGKLNGFEVVVQGEPLSDTDIGLSFKKVNILRKSRFTKLFGKITIRLPSRLIRLLASKNKKVDSDNGDSSSRRAGPYLRLRYVDDDLRMHTTDNGNWFIQTRL